jgi:hypothetical protein
LRRLIILFSCVLAGPLVAAEPTKLVGDAIKQTIAGSLLELDTPLGTTVSIRFAEDGLMSGDARELASLLGAATDRGRWWVAGDQLCYKWFRWFDAEARCLLVRQEDKRIFWQRDDGENGTATLVEQGRPSMKPALTVSTIAEVALEQSDNQNSKASPPASKQNFVTASADAAPEYRPREVGPAKISVKEHLLPMRRSVPTLRTAVQPAVRTSNAPTRISSKPQTLAKSDTTSFRVSRVEDYDVLNIRGGPSEDHAVVGEIPPTGHGIKIIGRCLEDWCPIKHHSVTGWVNRYYLVQEMPR